MEVVGVALAVAVALLWGTADYVATLAARRLGTVQTTFFSQAAGLCALLAFDLLSPSLWATFTPRAMIASAVIGAFTGICASVGYWAFYKALEIGPVALVSPLSSSSAMITLLLSIVLLQERLTPLQNAALALLLPGLVIASTNVGELGLLLKKKATLVFRSRGVGFALIAAVAFGAMDFGIGASARQSGWFLPVLWSRTYSLLFLTLIFTWMDRRARPRFSYSSIRLWRRHVLEAGFRDTSPFSLTLCRIGLLLASIAGMVENAAVLLFSIDTLIAQTGVTAVIASNYSLVAMLFGCLLFYERLERNQVFGIGLVLGGLSLLALG